MGSAIAVPEWVESKLTTESYELGQEKNGVMPAVDTDSKLYKTSNFGYRTDYLTGAGRLQWGEGIPDKVSRKRKRDHKKRHRILNVVIE